MPQELDVGMAAIGKRIREQDNLATDAPMFIVQQVKRIYGLEREYAERYTWISTEDPENTQDGGPRPRGRWRKVWYTEIWEFVTACFTREACEDYIACNGHNLKNPRIYADGSYRNKEFRAVRDFLIGCSKAG